MPGRDGTGPMGAGPASGWGHGRCRGGAGAGRGAGYPRAAGYGWGRGGGRRRGAASAPAAHRWGAWWRAAPPADERAVLESEEAALRAELDEVQRRLGALGEPGGAGE